MKRITGRLTEKNGKWYAVINLYTPEGKRKEKWQGLDLEAKRGTKSEANYRLNEVLAKYNSGELYLMDTMTQAERERVKTANMPLHEYIAEWLDQYKHNIAILTYGAYKGMVESRIVPYFKETSLTLKDITGEDLNAYYAYLLNSGLKGITAQKHHALLHLAFKHAVKHRIIPTNPCDQANRPKSEKYIADYYNADKLKQLLNSLEGDPMRIVVILTIYYGLRRSEVLGLKWSAIDFKEKRIHICHKIIEDKTSGKTVIRGVDVMKSKSSFRSLPLIPFVEEELIKEKEKQEEMQRVLRKTYNRSYLEYVCVNPLGNIIKPQYVTEHFKVILRKHGMDQIRFHDLRHSCATLMLSNHEEMKKIQAWLGHSTITITADTYTHLDMSGKVTSAEKIATSLEMLAT